MKTSKIVCAQCGNVAQKPTKEIDRQMREGRTEFFCSIRCSAIAKAKPAEVYNEVCSECGSEFETTNVEKRFCSRSCASAGSVTDTRRAAAQLAGHRNKSNFNLETTARGLRTREWPRYRRLHRELTERGIAHTFEHPIPAAGFIVDLMLHASNTVVEFDEYYHSGQQIPLDAHRNEVLEELGFNVVRVRLKPGAEAYLPFEESLT